MTLLNMRYKSFVFPSNPAKTEVLSSKSIACLPLLGGDFNADEIAKNASVITVSGSFYGEDALQTVRELSRVFNEGGEGWLFLPSGRCFLACFKSLLITENADKGGISYEAVFLEKSALRGKSHPFGYTFAQAGENAFDIAERCGISVEELMECNTVRNPFDIEEGDRIWLN